MSEAPVISPQIQSLKEEVCKKAERQVFEEFPKKVVELSEALKGPLFTVANLSDVQSVIDVPAQFLMNGSIHDSDNEPGTKRRRTDEMNPQHMKSGMKQVPLITSEIPCNKHIQDIIDYLKPEIISAMDYCSDIKLWIQLMIPKIEDGNNFGVSIQEDILSEVTKAESDASTYLDQIARYFTSRGKMVSKLAKYPLLQDYRRALTEYDEKVYLSFKLVLTEVRNIYIVLYDVVLKNYEKLKKPRSINTTSLY